MQFWIAGTDTNVGKTAISAWIASQTGFDYWKPVQTGSLEGTDSDFIRKISGVRTHPEAYCYQDPISPHEASKRENRPIHLESISIPTGDHLIIEGVGGVMVPLNQKQFLIDLMESWMIPVIVVARSTLGTINHTCLTIEVLKSRKIPILGVILNGPQDKNRFYQESIEHYTHIPVLSHFLWQDQIIFETYIQTLAFPEPLKRILQPFHSLS
jgi:dethiobiotin synthetase